MSTVGLSVRSMPHDALLDIVAAGEVITTAVQIGAILDLKAVASGYGKMSGVIDVTAFDVASGDEVITLEWQGSNSATFTGGGQALGIVRLAVAAAGLNAANVVLDRYITPLHNQGSAESFQFVRLVSAVSGVTPSITLGAFISEPIM